MTVSDNLFIKFRKNFYRFFIPISFSINPLFLFMFSEKLNAQTIKLTCDVKTHIQQWEGEIWKNIKNMNWDLEVNQRNKIVVKRETLFYEGRNYDLVYYFNIMNDKNNKIVAFREEEMETINGGLASTTMTLDLNSMKISTANHMQDNRGYSFSLHYGICFQK
tara:strand:- start:53 stop:541 length:489 start_codon:yes stop_codon:yes gene_type:complete